MKLYFIFTKKGLAVMLALTVIALILLGQFSTISRNFIDGSTHYKRMEFLNLLNVDVVENAVSVKNTRLPQKLSGGVAEYNRIQQKAGFDLSNYCGKSVTVYTYSTLKSDATIVNLLICNGKIIAGDITDTLNGITAPLIKEK